MGTTQEVFLRHVCPALGAGIAFVMFLSPLKAVLAVNRSKQLGEMNALPFIAMAANCIAWILYGFLNRDFYVYCANIPGLMAGMFYVLVCYKFSKEQAQDMLRNLFLAAVGLYFVIGLADLAADMDFESKKKLWGSTAVGVLAFYYTAPLSSLAKVVAERDSSSLHWPLCAMNIVNGMLWFAYGLAIRDWFISLPNGIGAAFNVVCLVFCFVFPAAGRSRLAGQVNPAANWAALRLQSIRQPAGGSAAAAGASGGFFDLTQLKWRESPGNGFFRKLSSRLSGRFNSSSGLADPGWQPGAQQQQKLPAGGAAVVGGGTGLGNSSSSIDLDVSKQEQLATSSGGSGDCSKKIPAGPGGDDVEQGARPDVAYVKAASGKSAQQQDN